MTHIESYRDLFVWQKSMDSICGRHMHPAQNWRRRYWWDKESNCSLNIKAEALIRDAQEVGRMINGLVRSLEVLCPASSALAQP
jgi:hypothetical protein